MNAKQAEFLEATTPYLGVISNLARHLSTDPYEAEDLVQETYLQAFVHFSSHRGETARPWLVAICLNLARSQARRSGRRPREVLDPDPGTTLPGQADVCDEVLGSLDRRALGRALATLPREQRLCLVLVDICGLTAAETADALGCPRGTVLARVHRGRRRLVGLMEQERADHA